MSSLKKLISETVHNILAEMAASKTPEENTYITYGFPVSLDLFKRLSNDMYYINKPRGGLWGSPTNSDFGWKDWCESEDFVRNGFDIYTIWKLKPNANILVIDSPDDLRKILDHYGFTDDNGYMQKKYFIDYLKIVKDGYDGVFLTDKGNRGCHSYVDYKDGYSDLNTWDCESIVVWNPSVVEIVETNE